MSTIHDHFPTEIAGLPEACQTETIALSDPGLRERPAPTKGQLSRIRSILPMSDRAS